MQINTFCILCVHSFIMIIWKFYTYICAINGIMHPGTYIPWLPFVAKVANLNDAQKVHGSQWVIPVYYKVGGVP